MIIYEEGRELPYYNYRASGERDFYRSFKVVGHDCDESGCLRIACKLVLLVVRVVRKEASCRDVSTVFRYDRVKHRYEIVIAINLSRSGGSERVSERCECACN